MSLHKFFLQVLKIPAILLDIISIFLNSINWVEILAKIVIMKKPKQFLLNHLHFLLEFHHKTRNFNFNLRLLGINYIFLSDNEAKYVILTFPYLYKRLKRFFNYFIRMNKILSNRVYIVLFLLAFSVLKVVVVMLFMVILFLVSN